MSSYGLASGIKATVPPGRLSSDYPAEPGRASGAQLVSAETHTLMHQALTLAVRQGYVNIACEACGELSGSMGEVDTRAAEALLKLMAEEAPEPDAPEEYVRPVQPHRRHLYPLLPSYWSDKTWETWDIDSVNQDALIAVQAWLETLEGTLALFGLTGTGKTHLLSAAAHELLERKIDISPWEWDDWVSTVRGLFAASDHEEIKAFEHRMQMCGVLILDDVRAESTGQGVREIFERVIHKRTQAHKPIMLTTNAESKWQTWSNRSYSRLRARGQSTWVPMAWEDRRLYAGGTR